MKTSKERELIQRCQAGDESAYTEFYQKYSSQVYTLSCRLLRDKEWANDAVQEIFIKAFRGLKNFQVQSKISTWLYRITINQCRDMLRQRRHRPVIYTLQDHESPENEFVLERIPDTKPNPEQEHTTRELRQKIIEAINRLPEEFAETFYLNEIEELSYAEIGQILGVRIGTVKSRIFRARELLQQELSEIYNEIKT
ncbi:MAG: sigma-70 family RNA polymerase sigma factor [bacterium]|nr:sigma-70 family RNA polymerase sigma factor [bacterium]